MRCPNRDERPRLRFEDFARVTRSHTIAQATDQTAPLLSTARRLLGQAFSLIDSRGSPAPCTAASRAPQHQPPQAPRR
ncbi:hypothetical protein ACIBHX_26180 [Nonomuraea sp. NPDC050536]|uniref:DinB/UmuC family translesion DNA polymerase n=1 Tax=Nonomuraea sp. NPDC050536 TaxID=3364366 RepID=UPI0037CAF12A